MKTLKFVATMVAILMGMNSFAQTHDHSTINSSKTDSIEVLGNCDMCKTRIEKAAKIEGVSKAEWNSETKILTIVYDPSKVKSDDVQKKIAAAGHDTDNYKADNKVYKGLPDCCQYERKK